MGSFKTDLKSITSRYDMNQNYAHQFYVTQTFLVGYFVSKIRLNGEFREQIIC